MQERAAAAGGKEVHVEFIRVIAIVVVPVAGDDGAYARATLARDGGNLEEIFVFILTQEVCDQPRWFGDADEKFIFWSHLLRDEFEVVGLGCIEILGELNVDRPISTNCRAGGEPSNCDVVGIAIRRSLWGWLRLSDRAPRRRGCRTR